MAFMAKQRAQAHCNAGTRILTNPSSQKALQEAIKHLQKATKLDPSFADAFHNLAHAWYTVADYNAAVNDFRRYTRKDIQDTKDSIRVRDAFQKLQDAKGSIKVEDTIRDALPDMLRDALQSALGAVDQALAIRYEFPQAHNTRAMVLAKLGRLDDAIEATEVALSQAPDYKNASENREKIKEMIRERATIPGYRNEETPHADKIKEMIFGKEERTESSVKGLFKHANETDEMLAQISRDPNIGKVLGQHGRTPEDLKDIWSLLLMTGTGEKKALSVVRNPKLLSTYLRLEAEGKSPIEIVAKLFEWE